MAFWSSSGWFWCLSFSKGLRTCLVLMEFFLPDVVRFQNRRPPSLVWSRPSTRPTGPPGPSWSGPRRLQPSFLLALVHLVVSHMGVLAMLHAPRSPGLRSCSECLCVHFHVPTPSWGHRSGCFCSQRLPLTPPQGGRLLPSAPRLDLQRAGPRVMQPFDHVLRPWGPRLV